MELNHNERKSQSAGECSVSLTLLLPAVSLSEELGRSCPGLISSPIEEVGVREAKGLSSKDKGAEMTGPQKVSRTYFPVERTKQTICSP